MKSVNDMYAVVCIAVALSSCTNTENTSVEETRADEHHDENLVSLTKEQAKVAGIEFGKVELKQISGTIRVSGVLDVPPQQLVSVSVPLGGFLKNTPLLQGSRVRKGEVIAVIENLDFVQIQQDYLESKSQLELAHADYVRQQELAKENVNSQKTLQQAKSSYSTWQARYNSLREKLRMINVNMSSLEKGNISSVVNLFAPIDGYVTTVNVNIGKFVNPTDVLFEIVDPTHLHAELIVFERDVPKLKIGQRVRFTLANETEERMATVYMIGRAIAEDRTVRIHCHIEKEDHDLLPGMFLSALVETGSAKVPALPNDAVVDFQGRKYIFVSNPPDNASGEQSFSMIEIQTTNTELGYTQVSVPDSVVNELVVVKGAYSLLSKMKNTEEEEGHVH
jgi:membrane fusion protein, heavy metal efflux system